MSPFLLTMIAASTTVVGALFSVFFRRDNAKVLSLCLSFSAGVMIYLSFMEILPKGMNHIKISGYSPWWSVLAFFSGIAVIMMIDALTPKLSHPHEGGHQEVPGMSMEKLGLMTMVLITIHNFPEGMAVYSVASNTGETSWPLILAIAIHNIPEGIVIAAPIYFATGRKKKALLFAFLSALAEPIGGVVGYEVFKAIFEGLTLGVVFCFVSGIMIFLSLEQLLPEARRQGDHHYATYGVVSGMLFMSISLILLS